MLTPPASGSGRITLRLVSTDQVHPHEIADPVREARIERRLREDGLLRDPLVVGAVPDVEGHILLDGTNRQRALRSLGMPLVLVQIVDYADPKSVQLRTWCHAAGLQMGQILEAAAAIPNVTQEALPLLGADEALAAPTTLALLLDGRHGAILSRPAGHGHAHSEQLRVLVDLYERSMERVDCDPEEIEERAKALAGGQPGPTTLVAFPRFSRSQVVGTALNGTLIPAGITRHVILMGRALRVNVPLEMLSAGNELESANEALERHLSDLHPRVYREPTVLYDS